MLRNLRIAAYSGTITGTHGEGSNICIIFLSLHASSPSKCLAHLIPTTETAANIITPAGEEHEAQ